MLFKYGKVNPSMGFNERQEQKKKYFSDWPLYKVIILITASVTCINFVLNVNYFLKWMWDPEKTLCDTDCCLEAETHALKYGYSLSEEDTIAICSELQEFESNAVTDTYMDLSTGKLCKSLNL